MNKGCPICGSTVENDHHYCRNCGHPMWDLPPGYQQPPKLTTKPEIFCSSCGVGMMRGLDYCPNCGANLPQEKSLSSASDGCVQATAIIVFIVIGLPAAACGGCSLLLMSGGPWTTGIPLAIFGFGVFGALLYWVVQTFRK